VDARQALIQAINAFSGAVVLVSHDSHLIELIADRLWLVADGTVTPFDGDLDDYRARLIAQRRGERRAARQRRAGEPEITSRKAQRRNAAESRNARARLRATARAAETRVGSLAKERKALEAHLADPSLYQGKSEDLQALQLQHGVLSRALAKAEAAWLEAQEALENG
jgi:ATP-binding cassette subfamily F protein 3